MNLAPPVIPSAAGEDDEASVPLGREHEHATSDSDIDLGAPVQPKTGSGKLPPDSGVRLVEDWLMAKDQIAQSGLSGLGLAKTSGPKSKPPSGKIPAPQPAFNLAPEPPKAPPTPAAKAKSPAKDSDAFDLQPLADLNPADSVFDASHNQAAGGPKSKPKTQPSIDLDQDEETISFDLAPDAAESSGNTMRRKMAQSGKQPAPAPAAADEGSSEFDLSPLQEEGSSEFDLTPLKEASDSSSEFELTLDDDAGLAPMEEEKPKPKAKAKAPAGGAKKPAAKAEASDLELSPLEEDTNLESSDFELAVEEDSSTTDNDTSSEVVVVEDGDLGDSPLEENVVVEEDGAEVVGVVEDEEEGAPVVAAVAAPAEWGWWSLFHVPTAVVMLFTGFLLMEMMRSIYSYQQPGPVGTAVFDMINKMFK
jgi:hypothetical protein